MERLTNEELARIYGAYLGCLFQYPDQDSPDMLCGVDMRFGNTIAYCFDCDYDIKDCKLLLTPLSEITDKDAIEVAKIAGITEIADSVIKGSGVIVIHSHSGRKLSIYHNAGSKHVSIRIKDKGYDVIDGAQHIYDFLRSRGYDCGYGDIPSLIEAGIAIDKTTINQ